MSDVMVRRSRTHAMIPIHVWRELEKDKEFMAKVNKTRKEYGFAPIKSMRPWKIYQLAFSKKRISFYGG